MITGRALANRILEADDEPIDIGAEISRLTSTPRPGIEIEIEGNHWNVYRRSEARGKVRVGQIFVNDLSDMPREVMTPEAIASWQKVGWLAIPLSPHIETELTKTFDQALDFLANLRFVGENDDNPERYLRAMTYNKQKETTCCKAGYTVSKSARGTRVICKQCNQPTNLRVKLTEDDEDQPEPDLDPAAEILRYTEPLEFTVTNQPGNQPYSGKSFLAEITWPASADSSYSKIQPLIRFYDLTYQDADNPKGQPTAGRYYAATIAGHSRRAGLSLYNSEPAWYLDPQACAQVIDWINAEMSKRGYKLTGDWLDHHYESQEDPDNPELFTNPERVAKQPRNVLLEAAFRGMLKPYYDQIAIRATKVTYFDALADYTTWTIDCKRSGKQLPIPNRYQSLYTYKQAVDWRKQVEEWFSGIAQRHKMILRDFRVYGRLRKDPTFTFDTYRWKSDSGETLNATPPSALPPVEPV